MPTWIRADIHGDDELHDDGECQTDENFSRSFTMENLQRFWRVVGNERRKGLVDLRHFFPNRNEIPSYNQRFNGRDEICECHYGEFQHIIEIRDAIDITSEKRAHSDKNNVR